MRGTQMAQHLHKAVVALAIGLVAAAAMAGEQKRIGKETARPQRRPLLADATTTAPIRLPSKTVRLVSTAVPRRFNAIGFLRDRALDFCDFSRLRFHVPNGFRAVGLKARATCLAQAGFVYFDGKSAGIDRRATAVWRERRLEGGVGPIYASDVQSETVAGNCFADVRHPWSRLHQRGIVRNGAVWDDGRLHPLSCGAELQLFVCGFEIETYPLEYLDAIIGWFGLDPFNDDLERVMDTWRRWQTIPELKVRSEWEEKLSPPKKPARKKEPPRQEGTKQPL